ncbi:hypothetical protein ACFQQB_45115 [Nonomuraea rubra]|uniref:hypothetical protein n=1 Tax=Nonomuraea rubra TaxID=46180 RepID=UPI0036187A30
MNRVTQNLLLLLLGGALLKISAFSADFANYVKPGFRPLVIAAGVVLVVLAVAALALDLRRSRSAARQGNSSALAWPRRPIWPRWSAAIRSPPRTRRNTSMWEGIGWRGCWWPRSR